MFGSTILDVAIGLVFLFLAVSLAASAITEAIGSAVKLRQKTLRSGVGALLNDPDFTGLALRLYNHALVNPLAGGTAGKLDEITRSPAYIPSKSFALALLHILEHPPPKDSDPPSADPQPAEDRQVPAVERAPVDRQTGQAPQKDLAEIIDEVKNAQLHQALTTLRKHADDDRAAFLAAVGAWFDDAMDRVGGWYKRYTQAISVAVALVVCAILNADALRIGGALWRTPALTAELRVANGDQVKTAIDALDKAGLLGWAPSNFADPRSDFGGFLLMLLGWLIVAGASVFGAPFWFDTLQRFVRLAGTGPAAPAAERRDRPSA